MYYNKNEFNKEFDAETALCEIDDWYRYTTVRNGIELSITLATYDSKIDVSMDRSINFEARYIESIKYEKNDLGFIRFLVYKQGNQYPLVAIYVKPTLFLVLDIEQTGKSLQIPIDVQELL